MFRSMIWLLGALSKDLLFSHSGLLTDLSGQLFLKIGSSIQSSPKIPTTRTPNFPSSPRIHHFNIQEHMMLLNQLFFMKAKYMTVVYSPLLLFPPGALVDLIQSSLQHTECIFFWFSHLQMNLPGVLQCQGTAVLHQTLYCFS